MAEKLLSLKEVCQELQLSENQVRALVKSGALRGFLDQKTYKFRASDVQFYKKALEGDQTSVMEDLEEASDSDIVAGPKRDTSKIDLADIDAESEDEESDQTSVLAAAVDTDDRDSSDAAPDFDFSEGDLGLSEEKEVPAEEADQTSLLPAVEGGAEDREASPVFEFSKEEEVLAEADESDSGESVLAAEGSDSSLDILEIADESSTDGVSSGTGRAAIEISEEESSGEDISALAEVEETSPEEVISVGVPPEGERFDTDTVADILSEVDESSDEVLEILDLDEAAALEEPLDTAEVAPVEGPPTKVAETKPLPDEVETVGLPVDEEALTTEGILEGLEVGEIEGKEFEAEVEEAVEEAMEEAPMVAAGWEIVVPSKLGNCALIAAAVMLALGSVFLIYELAEINDGFSRQIVEFVNQYIK